MVQTSSTITCHRPDALMAANSTRASASIEMTVAVVELSFCRLIWVGWLGQLKTMSSVVWQR
jgi:hypothetical protein